MAKVEPIFLTGGTEPKGLDVRARMNPDTGEIQVAIGGAFRLSLSDFVAATRYIYGLDLPIKADDDPRQTHILDLAADGQVKPNRKSRSRPGSDSGTKG